MNESIFQEALLQVQARRLRAMTENERRYEEINAAIPPIAEINAQLAQTSVRILDIAREGGNVQERMAALQRENQEAQRITAQLLTSYGFPADYLDMHYTCEKCQDTGYANGTYCDCLRSAVASVGIARMNRSAQMQLSSFQQFTLDYYKGKTTPQGQDCYAQMKKVYNACVSYAANFGHDSPSLLFYGRSGLGKTHLSLAIAREAIQKGNEVIYDSVINLLQQVEKEHFGRERAEIDTLELLLQADLLILDDLGAEFDTPFYTSTIYNIINTRLNRSKPSIISTNLDYPGIRSRYEERIVSRLFAEYECLQFVGTDIRLLKKQNRPALI